MPTYEYRCEKGHTFEQVQKMSDKALTKCPTCGARAARVISGGQGVIFKGSGFYITDYGKDGKGPRKDNDSAGEVTAKADPKSEGKADSKPDAKPEPAAAKPAAKPDTAPAPRPGKPEAT